MSDPRKPVRPGQPLALAAEQVNWINAQMRGLGASGGGLSFPQSPYVALPCRNTSGSAVPRWGVLAVAGLQVTPSGATGAATAQFQSTPVLTGSTPSTTTNELFGIAVEPIASNAIGMLAIDGYVQAKIEVCNTAQLTAGPKQSTSELVSGGVGATIVWKEAGTGTNKWALVRLGSSGTVRLGTISDTWNKGSTATVTQQAGDGTAMSPATTFTATNYFATVSVSSGTPRVACALIDGTWALIAAECD